MIPIIQEHEKQRRPSFMDRLGKAAGIAATEIPAFMMRQEQEKEKKAKLQKENEVFQQLTGMDISGIQDPHIRQKAFDYAMQGQQAEQKFGRESQEEKRSAAQKAMDDLNREESLQYQKAQQGERLERIKGKEARKLETLKQKGKTQEKPKDLAPLRSGLKTLGEMRRLRKEGRLGIGSSYSLIGKTRKAAAKYSQLGKSMISLVSNIPIRNRQEFEVMAHDLYDPNITDEAAEGILDAMEQVIRQGLEGSENEGLDTQQRPDKGQMRPMEFFFK
jgi:hypothetical protein